MSIILSRNNLWPGLELFVFFDCQSQLNTKPNCVKSLEFVRHQYKGADQNSMSKLSPLYKCTTIHFRETAHLEQTPPPVHTDMASSLPYKILTWSLARLSQFILKGYRDERYNPWPRFVEESNRFLHPLAEPTGSSVLTCRPCWAEDGLRKKLSPILDELARKWGVAINRCHFGNSSKRSVCQALRTVSAGAVSLG